MIILGKLIVEKNNFGWGDTKIEKTVSLQFEINNVLNNILCT